MKKILKELEPKFNIDFIFNTKPKAKQETVDNQSSLNTLNIQIIRVILLAQLAKKPKYIIFTIIIANIKKALALKKYINFAIKILIDYYKYLNTFL